MADRTFPFVGARAQVTVAAYMSFDGSTQRSLVIEDGDEVTLVSGPDPCGNFDACTAPGHPVGMVHVGNLRPVPVSPGPDQPRGPRHPDVLAAPLSRDALSGRRYTGPTEPGPDQPTEHEDWRVSGLTDFLVRDGRGDVVAMFHRPEDAARVVSDHQDAPALRAEVQRLREDLARTNAAAQEYADTSARRGAEVRRLTEQLRRATDRMGDIASSGIAEQERSRATRARLDRDRRALARVKAERDAARAARDAATTDGLDQQTRDDVHLLRCVIRDFGLITTEAVRLNARDALDRLLLRARLAGEAPTDDKGGDRG